MTSAYSAFANQGVRMTPYSVRSVTDREGTVIEETRPEPARRSGPIPRS
jgi:membrane carboxypeptidase/penicillin-binding protein